MLTPMFMLSIRISDRLSEPTLQVAGVVAQVRALWFRLRRCRACFQAWSSRAEFADLTVRASWSPVAARWTAAFAFSSLAWGVAFGAAATAKMSVPFATAMSAFVFSGTAQLVAIQLWAEPLPLAAILLAAFSINARYLAMGATLAPLYPGRTRQGLLATFILSDAGWAIALRAAREGEDPHAALLTSNAMIWLSWVGGTLIGALAGSWMPAILLGALAWLVLALLAALLPPLIESRRDAAGPIVAAALAIGLDPLLPGSWHVFAAGLAGGALTFWMRRP